VIESRIAVHVQSPAALVNIGNFLLQNESFVPVLDIGRLAKRRIDGLSDAHIARCTENAQLEVLNEERDMLKKIKKTLSDELDAERKRLKQAVAHRTSTASYDAGNQSEYARQTLSVAQMLIDAAYKARKQQEVDHVGEIIAWCTSNVRNPNHVLQIANNIARSYVDLSQRSRPYVCVCVSLTHKSDSYRKDYVTSFEICQRACEELKQKITNVSFTSDAFGELAMLQEKEGLLAADWKELPVLQANRLRQLRVLKKLENHRAEKEGEIANINALDSLLLSFAKLMVTCALDFMKELENPESEIAASMKRQVRESTKKRVEQAIDGMREQLLNPQHLFEMAQMIQSRYNDSSLENQVLDNVVLTHLTCKCSKVQASWVLAYGEKCQNVIAILETLRETRAPLTQKLTELRNQKRDLERRKRQLTQEQEELLQSLQVQHAALPECMYS